MDFFTPGGMKLEDSESWAEASAAYKAGLDVARFWQPDARTALTEITEYPPAHQDVEGIWEIYYWSPSQVKGLLVKLNPQLEPLGKEEWGAFYRDRVLQVAAEYIGQFGFEYAPEVSQPGPENLSFVFRRAAADSIYEFVDVQISTSVMLTPPPRRFTINLVKNPGDRPLFGTGGGFETRLSAVIPGSKPDFWWAFRDELEYSLKLREAFEKIRESGLEILEKN
jgi:hypothetical protein